MDKKTKIYKQIHKMSDAWVADATIARLAWVSLSVIRGILLDDNYTPTPRIVGKIYRNLEEFLLSLQK